MLWIGKLTPVQKDDLPILAERFTTSKLKTFEDLTSIGTYGFRGEALASISHIAHLTVTTRTKDSDCAWKAAYEAGKLVAPRNGQTADPIPCAGRQGTQILVEDLFYNVQTRRRAFRSASEEYAKILDMVGRYAIHCQHVAFSCKKHGESGVGLAVPVSATLIDRVCLVYKSTLKNDTLPLMVENQTMKFKCEGLVSSANYIGKRTILLLFINHRSVESQVIRKAVERTYSPFLPKGGKPFVYLSLEIDPAQVDVNVHPTKQEVNFLHEEEIVDLVCREIGVKLAQVDVSRTFKTQSLLSSNKAAQSVDLGARMASEGQVPTGPATPVFKTPAPKPHENNLVRTDSRARKITSMLKPTASRDTDMLDDGPSPFEDAAYEVIDKEPTPCRLASIKDLRAEVRENMHNAITNAIAEHTFVGVVDENRRIAAIQSGIKLYLVDYGLICSEYFYQLGLTDFGNFGSIRLQTPLNLNELLRIAAGHESAVAQEQGQTRDTAFWDNVVHTVYEELMGVRAMLHEYFNLEISEDGQLLSVPLLVKGYTPCIGKLPQFLLRLGPHVEWTREKECFGSFLRELASFYVPEVLPLPTEPGRTDAEEESAVVVARREEVCHALEHVLFPAFKARLIATHELRKGMVEVADLKGLYRVFERC